MNWTVMYHPYTIRQEKKVERRMTPLIHCAVVPVYPVLSRNLQTKHAREREECESISGMNR